MASKICTFVHEDGSTCTQAATVVSNAGGLLCARHALDVLKRSVDLDADGRATITLAEEEQTTEA